MKRRKALAGLVGLVGGAIIIANNKNSQANQKAPQARRILPSTGTHEFNVNVNAVEGGAAANRALLGQNVHWVYGGDGLVDSDGKFRMQIVDKVKLLHPTSLRDPGGAQSDVFHWAAGMGPAASRGMNPHFHNSEMQPTLLGTQEFLELCEMTGAQPLITVNVVTGTPEEAAAWIRQTNIVGLTSRITGQRLPSVAYWEIGNEPYLQEGKKEFWLTPKMFVERANLFIRALRAVDSSIRIGVPLRTPQVSGLQATPYPDFANLVLIGVTERFDFLTQHNAYMPYTFDTVPDDTTLYWGTMGATATVKQNLADTRDLVAQLRPGVTFPQAITEYNALYSLGKGATDNFVASPLAALYVADLICMLAWQKDVLFAQYWSVVGNWKFGAIASEGFERPGYQVLQMLDQVLQGTQLAATVVTETFDAPRVGAAAAASGLPLMVALATRDGYVIRMLLLNKDLLRTATGAINIAAGNITSATLITLTAAQLVRASDTGDAFKRTDKTWLPSAQSVNLTLPNASVALLSLTLKR
jgi:alpha-N-arabinofuranosidase